MVGAPRVDAAELYGLLQNLASPIVAITSASGRERNGMIVNSAVRASIAPRHPRLALYVHTFNHSHGLILHGRAFALHLLRDDQWDLIHTLGFASGRERDKLDGLSFTTGETGCPLLHDCFAAFECRVANHMHAGASTFFLGDVVHAIRGTGERVMTAAHFRANLRPDWRAEYLENLASAQALADSALDASGAAVSFGGSGGDASSDASGQSSRD
ncbi:MAG: flavin reductase [Gemmatimonadetes bacterium]|nr:flavin reductase [Gemmatimonadota bacterium]